VKNLICALWGHRISPERIWRRVDSNTNPTALLGGTEEFWRIIAYVEEDPGAAELMRRLPHLSCRIAELAHVMRCARCRKVLETLSEGEAARVIYETDMGDFLWTLGPLRRFLRTYRCLFLGHDEEWGRDITWRAYRARCRSCGEERGDLISDRYLRNEPQLARAMGVLDG